MNIAFIGAGQVGAPLAAHLAEAGHTVVLAESKPGSASVAEALQRSPRLSARPTAEAIQGADVVFLATPFGANEAAFKYVTCRASEPSALPTYSSSFDGRTRPFASSAW
jgi:predicted dinucleotide-binding enzyme